MSTKNTITIKRWMANNRWRFVDDCGEVNMTSMVETWDRECSDGGSTLDPEHPAWDIAFQVAEAL